MKKKIAIYLAGSIKKAHEKEDETFWTQEDMECIKEHLSQHEVIFLNPAFRTDDLSDSISVFGRDMLQVFSSNIVFVDARDRRGLGVGAEMMWAKMNHIPVVTWAPKNSHYIKDSTTLLGVPVNNFVHPFVAALSDKIVENLVEGANWIDYIASDSSAQIKDAHSIGQTMEYYKNQQLHLDEPMRALLSSCENLKERSSRAHPQVTLNR